MAGKLVELARTCPLRRPMITLDDIRTAALALPGAEEKPSYGGRPSWRSGRKMFCWVREKPEALVLWVDSVEESAMLIETSPDKLFTIDHYDGHAMVLARLEAMDLDEATEMITESWRLRATKTAVKRFDEARNILHDGE